MGELLFHPRFRPSSAEVQPLRIDSLLAALDASIAAIERTATTTDSPALKRAARICRATRGFLATVNQETLESSPARLGDVAKFMVEVQVLMVAVSDALRSGEAWSHRIPEWK
jgi:hypothetical protein